MPSAPPLRTTSPLPPGVEESSIEAGGLRFRVLSAQGPPAARAGTPVLLLHGFLVRSEVWLPVLTELARSRPVLAPDLPCHGGSGMLPGKGRSIGDYRKAVVALLDAWGSGPVDVVGSSLGGALGAMAALDRPERVRRLVLAAASGLTPTLPGGTVRLYLPLVLGSYFLAPSPRSFRSFLRKGVFHDPSLVTDDWAGYLSDEWRPRPRRSSYLATANAMRRPEATTAGDLGRLAAPTLLLWGRQDAHFPWSDGESASRRIPKGRFVVYENCGHLPLVEKFSEAFAATLQFLDAADPVGPATR